MENNAIIDGDSIIFSALHPKKILDSFGNPIKKDNKFTYEDKTLEECYKGIDYILTKLFKETKCVSYIGYVQGKDNFRYNLFSDYKSNRKSKEPISWFRETKNYLIDIWKFNKFDGAETDDFINITKLQLKNSFICCIDSDLLGIEGKHYNWRKSEWVITSKEEAEYRFWSSLICGTHNGIKGIPKKGEKFVERLFVNSDYNQYIFKVFNSYINYFGDTGVEEFYKNYKCIKLLEKFENFNVPLPLSVITRESIEIDINEEKKF